MFPSLICVKLNLPMAYQFNLKLFSFQIYSGNQYIVGSQLQWLWREWEGGIVAVGNEDSWYNMKSYTISLVQSHIVDVS